MFNGRPFCAVEHRTDVYRCGLRRSQSSAGRADRQQSRGALAGDETQRWQPPASASASCAVCLTDSCCGKHGKVLESYVCILLVSDWSQYVSVLSGSYQRSHRFPYQVPSMLLRNTLHITAHHCTMLHVFSPFFSLARFRRNFHQAAASWVPQRDR